MLFSIGRGIRKKDFSIGAGGQSFLVARLMETDIVYHFLQENCAHYPYKLCPYKDSLRHIPADWFLWNARSPFAQLGYFEGYAEEAKKMLHDIFSKPRYVWAFMKEIPIWTWRQSKSFSLGDNLVLNPYTQKMLITYFPMDHDFFHHNKNMKGTFLVNFLSKIQAIAVPTALLLFLLIWIRARVINKKSPPPPYIFCIFLTVLLGLLCNALVCATFSGLFPRYQARIIWIIWLPLMLLFLYLCLEKSSSRKQSLHKIY